MYHTVPSRLKKMKVKCHRHAQVMGFILILGLGRLILENSSLSRSSPSVGKLMIEVETVLADKSNRFSEVVEQCASVASEASPCPHDGRWSIPKELSFPLTGEWEQENGYAPLLHLHFQQEDKIFKLASLSLYTYYPDFQISLSTKVANLTASLCLHISTNESSLMNK
ncbi:hypothetical protein SUGI_0366380 [Cryptomeria japonica]|nr:hypothetical protein SUGI_0366380 [Cryptomeria japonica]